MQGFTKGIPLDTDTTLSSNSDALVPSQKAVKTYIDSRNLQDAYNSSTSPEILTDSTRGAITVKRGSGADTDNIFEGKNGADTTTFSVNGNGLVTVSSLTNNGLYARGISRPAQLTANQNALATSEASVIFLSGDAERSIRGIGNSGTDGKIVTLLNIGTFNILLLHESGLASAGNRIITNNGGTTITILPNESVTLIKDVTTSNRWRVLSKSF